MGDCGFSNVVVHGPGFFRADMSLVEKVRFTETTNLKVRREFLNASNNINFWIDRASTAEAATTCNYNSPTFGQTDQAFQDVSPTNGPGGRLV